MVLLFDEFLHDTIFEISPTLLPKGVMAIIRKYRDIVGKRSLHEDLRILKLTTNIAVPECWGSTKSILCSEERKYQ